MTALHELPDGSESPPPSAQAARETSHATSDEEVRAKLALFSRFCRCGEAALNERMVPAAHAECVARFRDLAHAQGFVHLDELCSLARKRLHASGASVEGDGAKGRGGAGGSGRGCCPRGSLLPTALARLHLHVVSPPQPRAHGFL